MYVCMYVCVCLCIYIYIEREREKYNICINSMMQDLGSDRGRDWFPSAYGDLYYM